MNAGFCDGRPRHSAFPTPILEVSAAEFAFDFFQWSGRAFVSDRFREAISLDASAVRYYDVDADRSAPLPRSKKYMMMEAAVTEDLADHGKSKFFSDAIVPRRLGLKLAENIAMRADAAASQELFCEDTFTGYLFCTDTLALRALNAGCTGVWFLDPSRLWGEGRDCFRTLRGLEQYVRWDQRKGREVTRVVETFS